MVGIGSLVSSVSICSGSATTGIGIGSSRNGFGLGPEGISSGEAVRVIGCAVILVGCGVMTDDSNEDSYFTSFAGGGGGSRPDLIVRFGRFRLDFSFVGGLSFSWDPLCCCWREFWTARMSCGDIFRDPGWVDGSGLMAGSGLSSLRRYELDDRGVLKRSVKILLMVHRSTDETLFLLGTARGGGSKGGLDGLSTRSVFDRRSGLGPREKFCVPRTWAAFEG